MMIWRKWHRWIGTIAGLFLLMMAATGVFIQVDELAEWAYPPAPKPADPALFQPIDPVKDSARANELIEKSHPGAPLRALWLQARETGTVAIVVLHEEGKTVEIDLRTGQEGPPKSAAKPPTVPQKIRAFVISLHTLSIGGKPGHLVGAVVGVLLVFLSGSGLWMWVDMLRHRAKGGKRAWFW